MTQGRVFAVCTRPTFWEAVVLRRRKLIWDLCGGTGAWSRFYYENSDEYVVRMVDPRADRSPMDYRYSVQELLDNIRRWHGLPEVYGILGAFPCKQFTRSGARWWPEKDKHQPWLLAQAIDNAVTVLSVIDLIKPTQFWCLENPAGRAPRVVPGLGKWKMTFQPNEYGGWLNPPGDAYTKRTCLYGDFNPPQKKPVPAVEGSRMVKMRVSDDRDLLRAITPSGFARGFYEANR